MAHVNKAMVDDDETFPQIVEKLDNEKKEEEEDEMMMPMPEEKKLENMSEEDKKKECWTLSKNVWIITIGWTLVMHAWGGLSRLQSSIHVVEGLGTIAVSVLHAALMISCLIGAKPLISIIGYKFSIMLGLAMYMLLAAANGYADWFTMMPASILAGFFAAPMWTAQRTYFTLSAQRYSLLKNVDLNGAITHFIGIFWFFSNFGSISSSIISSTVLQVERGNTSDIPKEALKFCGAKDCPWNNVTNPNTEPPPASTIWLLVGIYLAIGVVGMVLMFFLVDQLPKWLQKKEKDLKKETKEMLISTLKQNLDKKQIALIPLTMYTGFIVGLYSAEFSKSFVTCSIGMWHIGYIGLPYAVMDATTCLILGKVVPYTGRIPIFTLAFLIDASILIILLTWMPTPEQTYVLYIIPGIWGITDAILQTEIAAFYAVIFKDLISAFATNSLWGALGWVISFAYSAELCTDVKAYVCLGLLIVSAAGYYLTEYWCLKENIGQIEKPKKENKQDDLPPSYDVAVIDSNGVFSDSNTSIESTTTAF